MDVPSKSASYIEFWPFSQRQINFSCKVSLANINFLNVSSNQVCASTWRDSYKQA